MRKPEDMTPKKIKRPDKGYIGSAVPFEVPQAPTIPAYVTIENIKRKPKPKSAGLKAAFEKIKSKEKPVVKKAKPAKKRKK